MAKLIITKSLYDWHLTIDGRYVFVSAKKTEPDLCVNHDPISRSMHVPFDYTSMSCVHAMLEVREQFEIGNHQAKPANWHLLSDKDRDIIEHWRNEYAIPDYEEDQVEIDW